MDDYKRKTTLASRCRTLIGLSGTGTGLRTWESCARRDAAFPPAFSSSWWAVLPFAADAVRLDKRRETPASVKWPLVLLLRIWDLNRVFATDRRSGDWLWMSFSSSTDPIIVTGGQGISCSTVPGFNRWYWAVMDCHGTSKEMTCELPWNCTM